MGALACFLFCKNIIDNRDQSKGKIKAKSLRKWQRKKSSFNVASNAGSYLTASQRRAIGGNRAWTNYTGAAVAGGEANAGNTRALNAATVARGSQGSRVMLRDEYSNNPTSGTYRDSNGNLRVSAVTQDIMRERALGRNWRGERVARTGAKG